MKLYAKVTSERASKGQGGKWLDIVVTGEDKRKLLDMHLCYFEDGKLNAEIYTAHRAISAQFSDMYNAKPMFPEAQGEKQKGE